MFLLHNRTARFGRRRRRRTRFRLRRRRRRRRRFRIGGRRRSGFRSACGRFLRGQHTASHQSRHTPR